jgi:hypothetical protein
LIIQFSLSEFDYFFSIIGLILPFGIHRLIDYGEILEFVQTNFSVFAVLPKDMNGAFIQSDSNP